MGKTGKRRSIKLLSKALDILKEYKKNSTKQEDFIFPFLRNDLNRENKSYFKKQIEAKAALINKCLKLLAEKAGKYLNLPQIK